MIVNNTGPLRLIAGGWFAALAGVVACSVMIGARLSTSVLLFLVCVAPMGVVFLIGLGAAPPTVAELLYAVDTQKQFRE
jgi:hypothetical protein